MANDISGDKSGPLVLNSKGHHLCFRSKRYESLTEKKGTEGNLLWEITLSGFSLSGLFASFLNLICVVKSRTTKCNCEVSVTKRGFVWQQVTLLLVSISNINVFICILTLHVSTDNAVAQLSCYL